MIGRILTRTIPRVTTPTNTQSVNATLASKFQFGSLRLNIKDFSKLFFETIFMARVEGLEVRSRLQDSNHDNNAHWNFLIFFTH